MFLTVMVTRQNRHVGPWSGVRILPVGPGMDGTYPTADIVQWNLPVCAVLLILPAGDAALAAPEPVDAGAPVGFAAGDTLPQAAASRLSAAAALPTATRNTNRFMLILLRDT